MCEKYLIGENMVVTIPWLESSSANLSRNLLVAHREWPDLRPERFETCIAIYDRGDPVYEAVLLGCFLTIVQEYRK